jgi:hypothetical protein
MLVVAVVVFTHRQQILDLVLVAQVVVELVAILVLALLEHQV